MASRPTQHFVKGQTILQEGSEGDRTYRIITGEVIICKQNQNGNLVPIAKLGPGEIFGEMYLFEGTKTRTASAIATSSEVMLEVIFQEELVSMLNRLSTSACSIFEALSMRLQKTSHQYVEMAPAKPIAQLPDGTLKKAGGGFIRRGQ
jgi:CRP/FNR family transcriptional regulator, cyclic AMP receptor protein